MRVLVGCERSGVVRRAFATRGHDAWSCDVEPADDGSLMHLQGDLLEWLYRASWDLLIAHPPCTYLCASGLHWNTRRAGREAKTVRALAFVRALLDAPVEKVAIENPVGRIGTAIRPADQYIQPYEFGDDASKRTGLWLRGLPTLVADPTRYVAPRMVNGRPRWANQTDSGQNRLGPSPERARLRAETYPGIARAMAEQWGSGMGALVGSLPFADAAVQCGRLREAGR